MSIALRKNPVVLVKVTVFLIWLVLIGLLLKRDVFLSTINLKETAVVEQAEREDYQGIYFRGQKIGYAADIYRPQKDKTVSIEQHAKMTLNVAGQRNRIDLVLKAMLARNGRLEKFTFTFSSPFYRMHAVGRTMGKTVDFTLSTGSATIHNRVELTASPMLSTTRRAYFLKQGMEKGEKFKIPWFDPVTLTGQNTIVEYRGREKVSIHGRVYNLHHFVEMFAGARVNSWLDDKGVVVKEESPAGFVFIKEPKFKAMAGNRESPELLSAVSAKLVGRMPELKGRKRMQYRLQFPDTASFQLTSGRQRFKDGLLTVTLESLGDFAKKNETPELSDKNYLVPSASVQSKAPAIVTLASKLTKGKGEELAKVRAVADYVYNHLEKRPVLGFPDALTVLKSGKGDCNEHSVLFTAIARAAGIPTRMVAGVLFFNDAFYYHAWNEVRIAGKWLSVDATTDQIPADLSHIKFVEGGIREQMRIGALLGRLSIEPLP